MKTETKNECAGEHQFTATFGFEPATVYCTKCGKILIHNGKLMEKK